MLLWEEYCTNDTVDVEEVVALLETIRDSELAKQFGSFVESGLLLYDMSTDEANKGEILRLITDIATTNSEKLATTASSYLQQKHSTDSHFDHYLRLVGLRDKKNFQGAITNFELLIHLQPGNFVFHKGGWGTGEIIEVSRLREEISVEFENVKGLKHISFENACKTLTRLPKEHFLAKRFGNPDEFEKYATAHPLETIHLLLRDLGPKTAAEIKDELCELVIPEDIWTKWWQSCRAKLKKDAMIETPENQQSTFHIRKNKVSPVQQMQKELEKKKGALPVLQVIYSHVRDFPQILKDRQAESLITGLLRGFLESDSIPIATRLQILLFLDSFCNNKDLKPILEKEIKALDQPEKTLQQFEIVALIRRALSMLKECRPDWPELFGKLIFTIQHASIRDHLISLLKEGKNEALLQATIEELLKHPTKYPELFVWYFQKVLGRDPVPFSDKDGECLFFEALLVLLYDLETKPESKDLVKKIVAQLTDKRYQTIRTVFEGASIENVKEYLLLLAKCHSFEEHEKKIFGALAAVVHPSLKEKEMAQTQHILWTTEESYHRIRSKIEHISTVEMAKNTEEIEVARSYGDLRENSEYKYALEKRGHLQSELRVLSQQFNHARIITEADVTGECVSAGVCVDLADDKGQESQYTILGAWDANPEKNVLSDQSKFVKAMLGKKKGETFTFRDQEYTITHVKSMFSKG